jgi:hypothetical protein
MDENTTEFKSTLLVFVQNQLVTQLSVVLSCYQMLQTYARNVKLEALALKLSDGEEARIFDGI